VPATWPTKRRNSMPRSNAKKMPGFGSVAEVTKFFETHDMGDYPDQLPEVDFDIALKRRKYLVAIDGKLMCKLAEIAKAKKLPAQKLIHNWLEEKVIKTDRH
jgi:hypothetical protein